ncbi:MAG TPA: alanine racemase, partial [Candidatus Nitrosocosmicus sp.]|nr:alanine racemase [Candidatus Nitrosocosmicus sp.]
MILRILSLLKSSYHPLNSIEIDKKKLKDNYEYLSSIQKNIRVAPVLKSNAYGHGINEIGSMVDQLNPPFICVDSIFEGYVLLNARVKT